ncbi:MAG: hypothetical protein COC15_03165, partial [Legionellales bacterium]
EHNVPHSKNMHLILWQKPPPSAYGALPSQERMQREHKSDWLIRLKNNRVILNEDLKRKHKIVNGCRCSCYVIFLVNLSYRYYKNLAGI